MQWPPDSIKKLQPEGAVLIETRKLKLSVTGSHMPLPPYLIVEAVSEEAHEE